MRKSILWALWFAPAVAFASASFVNPMDFDGSAAQKDQVVQYITEHVHKVYCEGAIDMCQDATLRMMERQELSAFKQATQATDKKSWCRLSKRIVRVRSTCVLTLPS